MLKPSIFLPRASNLLASFNFETTCIFVFHFTNCSLYIRPTPIKFSVCTIIHVPTAEIFKFCGSDQIRVDRDDT